MVTTSIDLLQRDGKRPGASIVYPLSLSVSVTHNGQTCSLLLPRSPQKTHVGTSGLASAGHERLGNFDAVMPDQQGLESE